jgi:predicted Zn-dependent protease
MHYTRGELKDAANARYEIAWYGIAPDAKDTKKPGDKGKDAKDSKDAKDKKPVAQRAEDDPSVLLVDAGIALAAGTPDKALDIAAKLDGVRPRILRAYAELDLGKAKDALADMDEALAKAPDNLEVQILREEARMIANDKERAAAADALEKLARKVKSKLARHALGMAYLAVGNTKDAQPQLEQALADISEDQPNPLAYRTRTTLAELLLASNDIDGAKKQIDQAVETNSGYLPALVLQAKVAVKANDPDKALGVYAAIGLDDDALAPAAKATLAEALCMPHQDAKPDDDKARAEKLLTQAKDKDKALPAEEIGRIAAVCDPKLPEKLGVPAPAGTATGSHHHHR